MQNLSLALRAGISALVGAVFTAACGGGGSGTSPPPSSRTVSLLANTSFTPWTTGSVGFKVSPALAADETLSCRMDLGSETACATDATGGRLNYVALPAGVHTLSVTITASGKSSSYALPWRIGQPDVVVVGGTPAGISAALAAARSGKSVVMLESSPWLGGMMTGGLAKSDVGGGKGAALGGISREFFDRARDREVATGGCSTDNACPIYFDFEPKVAMWVFESMLAEQAGISIQKRLSVDGVARTGSTITSVHTARGPLSAAAFVDATYEGDLTALAGVPTTTGREARSDADPSSPDYPYREDDAGVEAGTAPYGLIIDPYVVPGVAASGLIPFVQPASDSLVAGAADRLVMAYNYRLCVTDDPGNRVPFTRPAAYDPSRYEGSARVAVAMQAGGTIAPQDLYFNPARTVRSTDEKYFKHDLNGGSAFSTDMSLPEWNQSYAQAGPAERQTIAQAYRNYTQGLLYFWQTDSRFGALNAKLASFGLCKDEFVDNGHWPYRLYSRETRRMVGAYVMNENDVLRNGRRPKITDSIGMGAYSMDSHIRQITTAKRAVPGGPSPRDVVVSEGFSIVRIPNGTPYPVAYRSLIPAVGSVANLLNPVTLSSTALAYSSLRMEPTFMVLGQAAGTAAAMLVDSGGSVQGLSAAALQARLKGAGQIIE